MRAREHCPCTGLTTLVCFLMLAPAAAAQETRTELPSFQLAGASPLKYRQVGGDELFLHVYYPAKWRESDHRAAIVFFFGGGWVGGTPAQFAPQCRRLAERGLVAISAEYRVKPRHAASPADGVADAKAAVRWIRAHADRLGVDSQRIAAAGGSAGGHLAASTATLGRLAEETASNVSCVPDALLLFNPVVDTTRLGYGAGKVAGREEELSPVHHIGPGMPPTIIFHGRADETVPYENVARFQQRMSAAGNACQLVGYDGAAHGFFNPGRANSQYADTLRRADEFLTALGFLPPASGQSLVAGRSLPEWIDELPSANKTTQRRAAASIGLFGQSAATALLGMLAHEDAAVRYWAGSHLGDVAGPAAKHAATQLRQSLQEDQPSVRLAVAYALCRTGDDSDLQLGIAVLRQAVEADDRAVACSAAEFLGRLGPAAETASSPELGSLLAQLRSVQARHDQGGDYHIRGAVKNAVRQVAGDDALEEFIRPSGGGEARGWEPGSAAGPAAASSDPRPNILWISCEDISPNLGCYGDAYASTPNLDDLARQGARFERAFTPAGVCAVVRSGVITGVYPISLGSQHMRSRIVPPPDVKCFTEYLRAAGYFCTNKAKTDYQFDSPVTAWDRQGSRHNDWRDRAPGQPFFSVINLTVSHESQIRHGAATHQMILDKLAPDQRHAPELAAQHLPSIYPDTPEARQDWAWYADNISEMDRQAGLVLRQLEEDGLADQTIVVFWGDHGRGLPRGKRWIYDSGVRIPLIVRWPQTIEPETVNQELVSTQDFAPTMLAAAGVDVPPHMQGRVFLGEGRQPEPEFLFFHRDRMDEAYELMRAARDRRFKYIRNYRPTVTYAQHIDYMDKMPTLVDLRRLHAAGELTHGQGLFFQEGKPCEELYDLERDADETVNLAWLPEQAERLAAMRAALEKWQSAIGDWGMVPEPVLMETMRPGGQWQATAAPLVSLQPSDNGRRRLTIACDTKGSSIAFRLRDGDDDAADAADAADVWQLYTKPLWVDSGTEVVAKACRLGYRDSPTVTAR